MYNYKNTSDVLSVLIFMLSLSLLIQESCQEISENNKQKRAAWMPQGRMGKRYRDAQYKKAAWVPQGRFGKRVAEEQPQSESELTPNSHLTISQLLSSVLKQDPDFGYGYSLNSAVKRMPRMGVYRSKKNDGYLQSLAETGISGDVDAFSNDGEHLLRNLEAGGDKRAAWVPQGRFGKRSVPGGDLNDTGDKIRLTNISQHPTDPNALCFTVTKGPQKHVMQCLQMNAEGTSVELMPSEHRH